MSKGKDRSLAEGVGAVPAPAGFLPILRQQRKVPSIPEPKLAQEDLLNTVQALKERSLIQSREKGDYLDSFVSVRDLVRLNLLNYDGQQARDDYIAWDTLRFPAQSIALAGADDPTRESTSGFLLFDGADPNFAYVFVEIPHTWLERSYVIPYILWQRTTTTVGNPLFEWNLDYKNVRLGEVMDSSWTAHATVSTVGDGTVDNETADETLCSNFGQLDLPSYSIRDGILFRISRGFPRGEGVYSDDCRLLSFSLRVRVDAHGSLEQLDKLGDA
jgi:hypothetical protein